jgi:hypothetical protein
LEKEVSEDVKKLLGIDEAEGKPDEEPSERPAIEGVPTEPVEGETPKIE